LGTLGTGNDSFAEFVNERGQVAGWSFINAIINPATGLPTFEPFLWEHGTMLDLGTLGGTMGFPYGLNNRGQVIGISNLAGDLTGHPFTWKRGSLVDLGTLGGSYGIAMGINDAGEIVGGATNKNDQAFLAFLWKDGVMTNLGTLNGDDCSVAFQINSEGQVVGNSFPCAGGSAHMFLWQQSFMTDLNALLPPGSDLTPEGDGAVINDRGEIAGMRVLSDGDIHAFLLIPCDEHHPGIEGCDYSMVDARAVQSTASSGAQGTRTIPQPNGRRMMPWPRGFGAQPPARMLISRLPVSTASARFSADTVTDDLLGDHTLAQSCWPPLRCHHRGACEVNELGKLTGYCLAHLPPYNFCTLKSSNECPKGANSRHTSFTPCALISDGFDTTRLCSF
jgi:probable HAF family extracellular repeat protein